MESPICERHSGHFFHLPRRSLPANYGFLKTHRDALRLAFAEERVKQRGKTTTQVRPAALWLAGKPVLDEQWRFNAVAADAVSDAIRLTADQRAAGSRTESAEPGKVAARSFLAFREA